MNLPQLRCPACGVELELDDRFCAKCGAAMPATPTTPTGASAASAAADDEALERALHEALAPNYLLVRRIGAGGMGTVFLAREPALKRLVAVKVLAPALAKDPTSRARFQREAQSAAGISHPNVVSIYSVGELADGTPYFVMQHIGGESLAARLERIGPAEPAEGRRILGQIASALAAAHARGIIHRDIKPANVLYDDESGRVLVTDFGIAAVLPGAEAEPATNLTGTGASIGTPQYMSPEQLLAEKVTDRTDIYSLGLLAYELLAGAGPFALSSPREILAAHLRDAPRKLSDLKAEVDPELESLIAGCLAKQAGERPDAAALARRLGTTEAVLEWPPPTLEGLHGAMPRVGRQISVSVLLFVLPPIVMLEFGAGVPWGPAGAGAVALGVLWLVAVVLLLFGVRRLARVAREAARAIRAGYGWTTVGEVLADPRGDTGALIAGAREYAALPPAERNRFRASRLVAASARLLAVLAPIATLLLVFLAGALRATPAVLAPVLVFLPSVLLVAGADLLARDEGRAVSHARARLARRRTAREGARPLIDAWYESFEGARQGQTLARGPATHARLVRVATAAALWLLVVGAALVILPLVALGALGPGLLGVIALKPAATQNRVQLAGLVRPYRPPADSTITPLAAGEAFVRLSPARASVYPTRSAAAGEGPSWLPDGGPDPFPDLWRAESLIARAARGGLTLDERRYLERVAENPRFAQVQQLGRARGLDRFGALYVLPFPESAVWLDIPIPHFTATRQVAQVNLARAALRVAQGRTREAETLIRETASYGLLLMDEGHTLIETLIGTTIARNAGATLLSFYAATGRTAEAGRLRRAYDSLNNRIQVLDSAQTAAEGGLAADPAALRRYLIEVLTDSTAIRGLRWEVLHMLQLVPCTNLRELTFGPADDIRRAVETARRQLVRYPSEAALFEVALETTRRVRLESVGVTVGSGPRAAVALARLSGALLGNRRIPGCAALVFATAFAPSE